MSLTQEQLAFRSRVIGGSDVPLSAEQVRELLNYDPQSGIFTWRSRPREMFTDDRAWKIYNTRFAHNQAGCRSRGYLLIRIQDRLLQAHRVAWLFMTGSWPSMFVDHIDMNGLNNKWDNLREATKAQNMCNRIAQQDNKLGVKGVRWDSARHKFAWECRAASIRLRGRCDTLSEAVSAHACAVEALHGQFGRTS